tara:strand:- start:1281 stop:2066 length:786 start_codon:yes stop_codon:yes gene_type:complete
MNGQQTGYHKNSKAVVSFGIILHKNINDTPNILMINRKDSLCYIDFLRGKYNPYNIFYVQILIDKFSIDEKERIKCNSFKELWKQLWLIDDTVKLTNDYYKGETKFNIIKDGFIQKGRKYDLNSLINQSNTSYISPEWEFPKGRKLRNESNKDCAIREFEEETGIKSNQYKLFLNMKPMSESYIGENKIKYVHIYYFGVFLNGIIPQIDKQNKDQCLEIGDIKWLNYENSLNIIRDYHKTRDNIIRNIFKFIKKIDYYQII